jgi:hypothetical protein
MSSNPRTSLRVAYEEDDLVECEHGCCDKCCVSCLRPDDLRESLCYCGHPLCWFGRARTRAQGPYLTGANHVAYNCVCPDTKEHRLYMVRAVWGRNQRQQRRGLVVSISQTTGLVAYPSGTKLFAHYLCGLCLGEAFSTETVQ